VFSLQIDVSENCVGLVALVTHTGYLSKYLRYPYWRWCSSAFLLETCILEILNGKAPGLVHVVEHVIFSMDSAMK
jgi:hypothetical protein